MSLVTRCPKCASEYEVTADQLKLHDGLVRCGQCSNVFDGLACLKDSLPTLTRKAADTHKPVAPDDIAPANNLSSDQPSSDSRLAPVLDVRASSDAPENTSAAVPAPPETQAPPWQEPVSTPISKSIAEPLPEPAPAPAPTFSSSVAADKPAELAKPAKPAKLTVSADDGPFIPSVDRIAHNRPQAPGRQEPSLVSGTAWAGAPKTGVEPGFTKAAGAQSTSASTSATSATPTTAREPSLGSLLADDGEQPGVGSRAEPAIKVMGESRLRGDDPSAAGRTVPEFLEDEEDEPMATRLYWILGSIVLVLALMVQSLVTFRNDIVSAVPSLRPLIVTVCAPLSCEVSYVRQIERIFIVGSALQQDPDATVPPNQRAYNLRLTLQNRGAYPQPWPALMVTLTDASGTPVIKKALMPSQFLPPELLDGPFQAKQEVGLDIPLRVQGLSISGFELDRFFP